MVGDIYGIDLLFVSKFIKCNSGAKWTGGALKFWALNITSGAMGVSKLN